VEVMVDSVEDSQVSHEPRLATSEEH